MTQAALEDFGSRPGAHRPSGRSLPVSAPRPDRPPPGAASPHSPEPCARCGKSCVLERAASKADVLSLLIGSPLRLLFFTPVARGHNDTRAGGCAAAAGRGVITKRVAVVVGDFFPWGDRVFGAEPDLAVGANALGIRFAGMVRVPRQIPGYRPVDEFPAVGLKDMSTLPASAKHLPSL